MDSYGVYSMIEDVEGDFIFCKGVGFINLYFGLNFLGILGKSIVNVR